jgi:uncharacterized protein (DUF2344 family)
MRRMNDHATIDDIPRVAEVAAMKVIEKATTSMSSLRSMVGKLQSGSWTAIRLEQQSDADKIGRSVRDFVGNDLQSVTVIVIKG